MQKPKKAQESQTVMTEMIFPNDTNTLGNLMGGNLMRLLDIAGAIAAQKHCNRIVVTASVDNISFREPIRLGDVVTLRAKATRAFNSSLEIRIDVDAENIPAGKKIASHSAYLLLWRWILTVAPWRFQKLNPRRKKKRNCFKVL